MLSFFMISENQISIYKKDGLVKSSTCLSDDKVKDLSNALDKYSTGDPNDPILIADDVYTTGTSFKEFVQASYSNVATIQWCVFARQPTMGKVKALFTMPDKGRHGSTWE